jgi:hypothetical protein
MKLAGLPLHPLVIHAAVVLVPLAVALVVAFAVLPRSRWLTRWPTAVTGVLAMGSVVLAKLSGDSLLRSRPDLALLVRTHQSRGNVLLWLMVAFFVLTVLATWTLGGPSGLASGRGARESRVAALDIALPVVLVVGAVVVLVWVVLTGDAGARAVWG